MGQKRPRWSAQNAGKVSLNLKCTICRVSGFWCDNDLHFCVVFGVGSAQLCEECSNDIHQAASAVHNIKAIVSEPPHSEVMLNYVNITLFCVIQLHKEDCEKPKKSEK